ncbi:hypothetical protein KKB99_06715 [bacterium]|nr:hypothetical protein [bacterium]MBU1025682.1 hypothetical protein [bacterium]
MKLKISHKEINPIQHELEIEFGWVEVEERNLEPTTENHIQYHGGFLEDKEFHTSEANQERGYFYRMGVRHYSPMLGRFLQKDPMTISRPPKTRSPLSANPYTYALNQPLQLRDITGLWWDNPSAEPLPMPGCPGGCGGGGTDGYGGWREAPFRRTGSGGNGGGTDEGGDVPSCTTYLPQD